MLLINLKSRFIMPSITNSHFFIRFSTTKRYIEFLSKMLSADLKSRFIMFSKMDFHFFIRFLAMKCALIKIEISILLKLMSISNRIF